MSKTQSVPRPHSQRDEAEAILLLLLAAAVGGGLARVRGSRQSQSGAVDTGRRYDTYNLHSQQIPIN